MKMKAALPLLILIASLYSGLIAATADAAVVVTETQITTNTSRQDDPAIYDTRIVWTDYRNGNPDIYMYDFSTLTETQITTNTASQYSPDIYDDRIVWVDDRNYAFGTDIYIFDLSTMAETRITTNVGIIYNEQPAIYGDYIVWVNDAAPSPGDVLLYDLSTMTQTPITTNHFAMAPAIYGNRIVWSDHSAGLYSGDIYMYDLTTMTQTPLITGSTDQISPAIYGDRIVWSDRGNLPTLIGDIYAYDLSTTTQTQITSDSADQESPRIYGDYVVWTDNRNGNDDIYMYDFSTSQENQITTQANNQGASGGIDIYQNRVVFQDDRSAFPNIDIYMVTFNGWELVFTDPVRGTILRINPDDERFQFIAPGKDFGVKDAPGMIMLGNIIVIAYSDSQMTLTATAIGGHIDYCSAIARDRQTGIHYFLIDRIRVE